MHIDALEQLGGLDVLGSPKTDNQYHSGWGWAGSTPYKGVKLLASHLGGTRNPLAIRWPKKVAPDPVPRDHFLHCQRRRADHLRHRGHRAAARSSTACPRSRSPEQVSPARSPTASAPGGKKTQYFEVMGSRAHLSRRLDGLGVRSAGARGCRDCRQESKTGHPTTTAGSCITSTRTGPRPTTWPPRCPKSSRRCANCSPSKPPETRCSRSAVACGCPIFHPELRITPPYREWEFSGDITRIPEFCAPALGNKNNTVTIEADLPADASGVLYALGGFAGGVTCYLDDGYLCYEYNCFILSRTKIRSADKLQPGPDHDRRGDLAMPSSDPRDRSTSTIRVGSGGPREGPGAGQRAAAVHRKRLPRHRLLPRLTGGAGLLRQGALPIQRPHRSCPRRIHLTHRPDEVMLKPRTSQWRRTGRGRAPRGRR